MSSPEVCTHNAGGQLPKLVHLRKPSSGCEASSESLVVIAVGCPVPEHLTDFTVGAFLAPTAVVCGMGGVLRHLCLGRTILCVVEIKAVTYVTEEARFLLGLFLLVITTNVNVHHQKLISIRRNSRDSITCNEQKISKNYGPVWEPQVFEYYGPRFKFSHQTISTLLPDLWKSIYGQMTTKQLFLQSTGEPFFFLILLMTYS